MRDRAKPASFALENIFNTADYLWTLGDVNARVLKTAGNKLIGVLDRSGLKCGCEEFKGKKQKIYCLCHEKSAGSSASSKRSQFTLSGAGCRDKSGQFVPVIQCTGRRRKKK